MSRSVTFKRFGEESRSTVGSSPFKWPTGAALGAPRCHGSFERLVKASFIYPSRRSVRSNRLDVDKHAPARRWHK